MKFFATLFLGLGLILTMHLRSPAFEIGQLPSNGAVKLWDPTNGKERDISFEQEDVTSLAFSPDSKILAVGNATRLINLWDLNTGKKIGSFAGHKGAVQSLSFSPDGRILASGSWDRTIKLWNIVTGKQVASLAGSSGEILSVAFSPDGKYLAGGGGDEKVRLWNLGTNRIVPLIGHTGRINAVAFSPDGAVLASGSDDKTVRLWEVETGRVLSTLEGHSGPVESVAFNPRNKTLASSSRDKTIKIWDVPSGSEVLTLKGHISSVDYLAFSSDGKTLASGSYDKTVKLWDVASGKELRTLEGHAQRITSLAFSPDGKILASGSALNPSESPTLYVLAVGITNYYNSAFPAVDFAAKDATDFAAALEKAGRAKFERVNVRVFTNYQANQMGISWAIDKIVDEAKPQDVFVLFFAGLASLGLDEDMHEEQFGMISANGERVTDMLLRSWLTKIEARHQLIILETKDSTRAYESFIKQFATENKALRGLLKRDLVILANAFEDPPMPKLKNRFLTHRLIEGLAGGAASDSGELTANSLVGFAKGLQSALPKAMLRRAGEISSYAIGEDFQLGYVSKSRPTSKMEIFPMALPSRNDQPGRGTAFDVSESSDIQILSADKTRPLNLLTGLRRNHNGQEPAPPQVRTQTTVAERVSPLAASQTRQVDVSRKGKDYALFIATNEYVHWKSLGNAVRDAEEVAKELQDYYGFQTEIVKNAPLSDVVDVLQRYGNRQYADDDQLFIFFAGHGTYNKFTRQGYLAFSDALSADEDKIGKTALSYTDLRNIIDNLPCRHIFLVIDACYSGTFDESIAQLGTYRGDDEVPPPQFIQRIMQFRTRRYLTSAGNEPVYDGDKGGNSPFTKKLLEAFRKYGGGDGYITIATILGKVQRVTPTPISREWGQDEPGSDFFFIVRKP